MGREFELKFAATEEILQAVAACYTDWKRIEMETVYYDTPDGLLAQKRVTLRRRMENGRSICTVKTPLPDGSRGEWELEHDDPATMVQALCASGAPEELKVWTAGGICPVCGARFTRLACSVSADQWAVELALDRGVLLGGGRQAPLCELEVELKHGCDADAVAFAQSLAAQYALLPEGKSKFRRARELQENENVL